MLVDFARPLQFLVSTPADVPDRRPTLRRPFAVWGFTPLLLVGCLGTTLFPAVSSGQEIRIEARQELSGIVERREPGELHLRTDAGEAYEVKIQDKGEKAIRLEGLRVRLRFPAEIEVRGKQPLEQLVPGQIVRLATEVTRTGRARGEIALVEQLPAADVALGVEFLEGTPQTSRDFARARITGEVVRLRRQRLQLRVEPSESFRDEQLAVTLREDAELLTAADDLSLVDVGDRIVKGRAARLSSGDWAFEQVQIELAEREVDPFVAALQAKYRRLSNEPSPPRNVRSQHFLMHTDISDRQAQILLDKLERMVRLISQYYGRTTPTPIECYVVRDLAQWPQGTFEAAAAAKIARGEGVTVSRSLRGQTRSIVFSCDDHGVVQHESVHAFCAQAFGSPGPTWYAEGMAEMGQYWREDDLAVRIDPVVINYLTRAEPKRMLDIVAAGQITGDSWQAYAWRWALCHLLASNSNYAGRFKSLGMAMMSGQEASFESAFGPVANEISFEYDFFVKHFGNGYRVDLCQWDWQTRFSPLRLRRAANVTVVARGGWQASGVAVEAGQRITVEASGQWRTSPVAEMHGAVGEASGRGRLLGIVLTGYELSEPFPLAVGQPIELPASGKLYLRIADDWTQLDDNEGELEVSLTRAE